jgi:putative transposase
VAGHVYHVLNRGNGGATVFHKDGDYTALLDWLATAKAKYPITLFSVSLMPTHVHPVVQPATDAALSPFMPCWMTSHVRRYPRHYHTHGHVWQGRFKRVPIQ